MCMKKILTIAILLILLSSKGFSAHIIIPMGENQKQHLKAYGVTYWVLQNGVKAQWLLNYDGGSFLFVYSKQIEDQCIVRGVTHNVISDAEATAILNKIASPSENMDAVKLDKAPKIAVYSPKNKLPWDDAVTMALTYAEIPYEVLYDKEIIDDKLVKYDWLHLHHEDFTGQFGRFYANYSHTKWYNDDVNLQLETAKSYGFNKVSELKKAVVKKIRGFVTNGGFLFAMCAATDTYDIALSACDVDICEYMFDGDATSPGFNERLNYEHTFAFHKFSLKVNPLEYEYSDIDATQTRKVREENDYFTLFDFSAKWDPIPTILTQNHETIIKGFMGQTTSFNKHLIKPNVVIMGENKKLGEARYIHGKQGKGYWTFYGGHDPEDYQHFVGDPKTELKFHPNSPGYRLILNNILFPATKKKKLKT